MVGEMPVVDERVLITPSRPERGVNEFAGSSGTLPAVDWVTSRLPERQPWLATVL
jgi:hypothetical protein